MKNIVSTFRFNPEQQANNIIQWIRSFFLKNAGADAKAVVGISGGKDSLVTAALCVEALGKDRVYSVIMPNNIQPDVDDAFYVQQTLSIDGIIVNVGSAMGCIVKMMEIQNVTPSERTRINLPARLRMTSLYAVAQSVNGMVANTNNASEKYVGWETLWGDSVGDFAPLANLTSNQVKLVGKYLNLPERILNKIPADGLTFNADGTPQTDEFRWGFKYSDLDKYLEGDSNSLSFDVIKKIESCHINAEYKNIDIPAYVPQKN